MPESPAEAAARIRRERQNAAAEKKGKEADAASSSEINQGDLAGASRKAKGVQESPPVVSPLDSPPAKPAEGATLGEIAAYSQKMREYNKRKATSGMSAGSQVKALQ